VHPADYFYTPVQYLVQHGVISGYGDCTFRPYNNITRGQASKIVVLAANIVTNTTGGPHFSDVAPGSTFYTYIETAYNNGIISGYADGTFRPNTNVTRGQFSKMIVQAFRLPINVSGAPHFSDVSPINPFYQQIETAYNNGLISGYADGTFKPNNYITRGQAAKITWNARTLVAQTPTTTATAGAATETVTTTAVVTVTTTPDITVTATVTETGTPTAAPTGTATGTVTPTR
jgi:hypothetical protein